MRFSSLCCFTLFFLLLFSMGIKAQEVVILEENPEVERYRIGKSMLYLEDKTAALSFESIQNGVWVGEFKPSKKDALNFGVTESAIWVKFSLQNDDFIRNPEWILRVKNALIDSIRLYSEYNGEWKLEEAGDHTIYRERQIKDHDFAFYLHMPDNSPKTYYMRFRTAGSMQIPIEVHTRGNYQYVVQLSELSFGLFTGAMLIMFIYNLFLFVGLKDFSYLFYSLFIITNTALLNAYSGHIFQYGLGNFPEASNLIIPLIMGFIPFTVTLFTMSFIGINAISQRFRTLFYIVLLLSLLVLISVFVVPIRLSTTLAGLLIIFSLVVAIMAGLNSWVNGNRSARFYVVAWILLILGGLITAFRNFGILDYNYFTVHGTRIATLLEVVLLSISLASRYRRFRQEKEDAQKEIIEVTRKANLELEDKVKRRTHQLEVEKAKSEDLLLNVLPEEIVNELKEKGKTVPRQFSMASVLFTDIKNFTRYAEDMNPTIVVAALNELFLGFDDICKKHGLEKIKTLGDGYMAVGGVPIANETNPIDAVRAGLEMQEWIKNWNSRHRAEEHQLWQIRLGINTGPVVAGVIGKHKFTYDIWGDTVNMASRMESSGEVGMVNISQDTYEYVKIIFECEYQGKVKAKNKGQVDLYHVIREKEVETEPKSVS